MLFSSTHLMYMITYYIWSQCKQAGVIRFCQLDVTFSVGGEMDRETLSKKIISHTGDPT